MNALPNDNQTRYGQFFGNAISSSESKVAQVLAVGGTASNLYVDVETAPGSAGGQTERWTFTIYKNGAAQGALQCAVEDAQLGCMDLTGSVTFLPGDTISIQIDADNNPTSNSAGSWSLRFA